MRASELGRRRNAATSAGGLPIRSAKVAGAPLSAVDNLWPATRALALAVAVLGLVVTGCGSSGGHPSAATKASTPTSSAPCKLDRAQRRAIARALADIRRLRRIQAPMQRFSQHGAPHQNEVTGEFELDVGSAHLPLNLFSHLIHLAKTAVSLCGDCTQGLEADEPVLGNRPGTVHAKNGRCE